MIGHLTKDLSHTYLFMFPSVEVIKMFGQALFKGFNINNFTIRSKSCGWLDKEIGASEFEHYGHTALGTGLSKLSAY